MVGVVFLDISKAFDSMDHNIMIHKLSALFNECLNKYLVSFLPIKPSSVSFL